jgi:hypothetical protein
MAMNIVRDSSMKGLMGALKPQVIGFGHCWGVWDWALTR